MKSQVFKSPVFRSIEGKIASMHVLVLGYDLEVEEKKGKVPKHFKDILHLPFEVDQNGDNYKSKILEEKINYITI